ncbi:hypothetical protein DFJ77DRAFT_113755 [Powellomyces hirtus]|nr:hypothetical protein DFJ77DRAFT_113755 [Powellomyces hirtus]
MLFGGSTMSMTVVRIALIFLLTGPVHLCSPAVSFPAAQLINTQSTPNKCLGIGNVEARGTGNPGDPVAFFSCGGSLASTKSQFFALASRNCGNPQTQQQQPAAPKQADPPAPVPVPVPAPVPAPQQPQSPAATPVAVPRPTFPSPPPQQPASPVVVALTTPVIAASPVFRPLPTFVIPTPTPSPISMNPTPGPVISPTADGAPPRTPALVAAAINIQSDPVAVLNMVPITHMMALVLLLAPIAVVSCVFAIIAMVRKVKHIRYLRKKIQLAES